MIFTYEGIKVEIKDRLKTTYPENWAKSLFTGVYERIIDFVAYISEKIVYVAEFFYREANWRAAQKKESLMNLIEFLPYRPHGSQGSSGRVQISADPTFSDSYVYSGASVIIPRWHKFETDDGDYVYCTDDTTYPTNYEGNLEVPVKEGIPKEFIFIANGDVNEVIQHLSDKIDTNEYELFIVDSGNNIINNIYICGESYDNPIGDVDLDIYFVDDLNNYYCEIRPNKTFTGVKLTFGDGIRNKKLASGDRILFKYANTEGADGNIQADKINKIKDTFDPPVTLYVRNDWEIEGEQQGALIGGTYIEDTESIRENGRRIVSAGDRCGNYDDWITILESKEYIDKAIIWTLELIGLSSLSEEQNKVFVTAIDSVGNDLTATTKLNLQLEIRDKYKTLTEIIQWVDSNRIYLKADVDANFTTVSETVMNATILEAINNKYDILNVDFAKEVLSSNIISLVDNLTNIVDCEVNLYNMEKELSRSESDYQITVNHKYDNLTATETSGEDEIHLYYGSPELWLQFKKNGEWENPFRIAYVNVGINPNEFQNDESNNYNITGSSVSYGNNSIGYTINDLNEDSVLVEGEVLTLDGLDVDDSLIENDIVPVTLTTPSYIKLYDDGVEISIIETNNYDGTGTIKDNITYDYDTNTGVVEIFAGTKVKVLVGYTYGGEELHIYESISYQGFLMIYGTDYSNISNWTDISIIYDEATITYATGELDMTFATPRTEPITVDYAWGVKNPDDAEDNGFMISFVYKTCDGTGPELYNFTTDDGSQTVIIGTRVKVLEGHITGGLLYHVYESKTNQGSIDLGTQDYTSVVNWTDLTYLGKQNNSIRLPQFYHIVDVDEKYIFTDLEYVVT
jgi:hypothetical protein